MWLGMSAKNFLELYCGTKCDRQLKLTQCNPRPGSIYVCYEISLGNTDKQVHAFTWPRCPKLTCPSPHKCIRKQFFNIIVPKFARKLVQAIVFFTVNLHYLATNTFTQVYAASGFAAGSGIKDACPRLMCDFALSIASFTSYFDTHMLSKFAVL